MERGREMKREGDEGGRCVKEEIKEEGERNEGEGG